MNTILTDDEISQAGKDYFWPLDEDAPKFARAIEAAVLAKLREQEPAEEVRRQALDALNRMQSIADMPDGRHPRDVLRAFIQLSPIYAAPQPAVVQQGWKLVPEEAIRDMLTAADLLSRRWKAQNAAVGARLADHVQRSVDLALAAAPEAPALPAEVREALKVAREALVDVKYGLEGARIWGGMDWTYNPLHPVKYLPLRDKTESAIARIDALGGVE